MQVTKTVLKGYLLSQNDKDNRDKEVERVGVKEGRAVRGRCSMSGLYVSILLVRLFSGFAGCCHRGNQGEECQKSLC